MMHYTSPLSVEQELALLADIRHRMEKLYLQALASSRRLSLSLSVFIEVHKSLDTVLGKTVTKSGMYYRLRRARGLCGSCKDPAEPGRSYCSKHLAYRDKQNLRYRKKRQKREAVALAVLLHSGPNGQSPSKNH